MEEHRSGKTQMNSACQLETAHKHRVYVFYITWEETHRQSMRSRMTHWFDRRLSKCCSIHLNNSLLLNDNMRLLIYDSSHAKNALQNIYFSASPLKFMRRTAKTIGNPISLSHDVT